MVDSIREENVGQISPELLEQIREGLSFCYPHTAATVAPSKQTATGLKGRQLDREAAEDTAAPNPSYRQWRKPSFAEHQQQGRDYGNAFHAAMQYIDYAACTGETAVRAELQRLVDRGYLSAQQAALVNPKAIADFFATDLGQELQQGNVVREFKFSLLVPADWFSDGLSDEQILLQGVVDCAWIEHDGITIIDFKTDFVTEETLPHKQAQYAPQVEAYAQAMERIYQKPVKQRLLYFFHIGRFVSV